MSTLVVYPQTDAQEKAVKAVLEALQINFDQIVDEAAYILSPAVVYKTEQGKEETKPSGKPSAENRAFLILNCNI
jgi:hypothetical protein